MEKRWPLSLLLLVVLARPVLGACPSSYKEGFRAVERQDWPAVARLMQEAIEEDSVEKRRCHMSGTWYPPYLPYYFLGLARFSQGDCPGALEAWSVSEEQGVVVQERDEYETLKERRARCGPDPAQVARVQREAETEIERAEQAAAPLDKTRNHPDLQALWSGDSLLGGRERVARRDLEAASSRLQEAIRDKDIQGIKAAGEMAAQARRDFEAIAAAATDRLNRIAEEEAEARKREERPAAEEPSEPEQGVEKPGRVEEPRRQPPLPIPQPADRPKARPEERPEPPTALRVAVEAYLGGRYETALEVLSKATFVDQRASAHAHLLQAASRYALYRVGGGTDLIRAARRNVEACRLLDPGLSPSAAYFSPAFRRFFEHPQITPPESR